ncbi:MAG: hypothetical protein MHMPM18_003984 [Marteilia pararefringens]
MADKNYKAQQIAAQLKDEEPNKKAGLAVKAEASPSANNNKNNIHSRDMRTDMHPSHLICASCCMTCLILFVILTVIGTVVTLVLYCLKKRKTQKFL